MKNNENHVKQHVLYTDDLYDIKYIENMSFYYFSLTTILVFFGFFFVILIPDYNFALPVELYISVVRNHFYYQSEEHVHRFRSKSLVCLDQHALTFS